MTRIASALLGFVLVSAIAAPSRAETAFDGLYLGVYTGLVKNAGAAPAAVTRGATGMAGSVRATMDSNGWVYGAYAGYGQVFSNNLYLGGEIDLGSIDMSGKGQIGTAPAKLDIDENFSLSVRAGYVVSDDSLLYGRIGWQRSAYSVDVGSGASRLTYDGTLDGVRYGVGYDYALTDQITLRAEYNRTDFEKVRDDEVQGRVGLSYRF